VPAQRLKQAVLSCEYAVPVSLIISPELVDAHTLSNSYGFAGSGFGYDEKMQLFVVSSAASRNWLNVFDLLDCRRMGPRRSL
jgi:hypothetical protein